jgi:hypothetical protein
LQYTIFISYLQKNKKNPLFILLRKGDFTVNKRLKVVFCAFSLFFYAIKEKKYHFLTFI